MLKWVFHKFNVVCNTTNFLSKKLRIWANVMTSEVVHLGGLTTDEPQNKAQSGRTVDVLALSLDFSILFKKNGKLMQVQFNWLVSLINGQYN